MLEHFFYGDKTISKNDIEEMIFIFMVRENEDVTQESEDEESEGADNEKALGHLIGLHRALYPTEDEVDGDLIESEHLYGTEKVWRDTWPKVYVAAMKRTPFPVTHAGKLIDLKDKEQLGDFLSNGPYSWPNALDFKQTIPRALLVKMATIHAGAEAARSRATYDYFRKEEAARKGK